jgi:hypothetical protein
VNVEAAFQVYLTGKAAISAIVSTRVYPGFAPQQGTVYPCMTMQRVSTRHIRSMLGGSQLAYIRIQLNIWARTYKAAKDLADVVRMNTDGFAGSFGGATVGSCLMEDEGDIDFLSEGAEPQRLFGVRQDYMIAFEEAAPTL